MADPWVYNEYTDGRNLPPDYDNLAGAAELIHWLVEQVPPRIAQRLKQRRGNAGNLLTLCSVDEVVS